VIHIVHSPRSFPLRGLCTNLSAGVLLSPLSPLSLPVDSGLSPSAFSASVQGLFSLSISVFSLSKVPRR